MYSLIRTLRIPVLLAIAVLALAACAGNAGDREDLETYDRFIERQLS